MPDIDVAALTDEQLAAILSESKRRIAALRATVDKPCEHCGRTMLGVLPRRTTCSPKCRSAIFWRRHHPKLRGPYDDR